MDFSLSPFNHAKNTFYFMEELNFFVKENGYVIRYLGIYHVKRNYASGDFRRAGRTYCGKMPFAEKRLPEQKIVQKERVYYM